MRCVPLFIFILGLGAIPAAAQGDDLPEGKGKDAFIKICSNCHGLDRATTGKYSKKQWAYTVDDMVSRGAEGTEEEVNSVISYLARNFGKPVNVNTASAKELETGLSFTAAQAESIVRYRADKGAFKTFEDVSKVPGLDAALLDEQKKNIVF